MARDEEAINRYVVRTPTVELTCDNDEHEGAPELQGVWEILIHAKDSDEAVRLAHAFWHCLDLGMRARRSFGDWTVCLSPGRGWRGCQKVVNFAESYRGCAIILTKTPNAGHSTAIISPTGVSVASSGGAIAGRPFSETLDRARGLVDAYMGEAVPE